MAGRAITRTLVVAKEVLALAEVLKNSEINLRDIIIINVSDGRSAAGRHHRTL